MMRFAPSIFAVFFALVIAAFAAVSALAQTSAQERRAASESELLRLQDVLGDAVEKRDELEREIEDLIHTRESVNQALIITTARMIGIEEEIAREETHLRAVLDSRARLESSMEEKWESLGEILAAAQRLGSASAPPFLVESSKAVESVRGAILLAELVSNVRARTDILADELRALADLTARIEERKQGLARRFGELAKEEARLALLLDAKAEREGESRQAWERERTKAAKLAKEADSLEDLIRRLERRIDGAARAASSASAAQETRRQEQEDRLARTRRALLADEPLESLRPGRLLKVAPVSARGRTAPLGDFEEAKGLLAKPVHGAVHYRFGSRNDIGGKNRNMAFLARPGARVRAPADSWVVYGGPFRSLGEIAVLNAGGGYHIVLSGMEEVNVSGGRFVLAGEPIGRMGGAQSASASTQEGNDISHFGRILYVEFRKGEKSIDPEDWWVYEGEEARAN